MTTTHPRHTMSGLDHMRRVAAGEIDGAPMVRLLGMRLAEVDEGRVVLTASLQAEHENGLGIAHGGFAATMLDTALSCAVNTVMPAGKVFTTLEMKINYIRAVTRRAGMLTCIGTVVHAGKTTATAEGRIVDGDGKLYAHGTVTCILFRDTTGETP
ncbi:MAG TPA: PaaI family thioesterase [Thermoanaerobaculia bacterium]|nr:PaaI family thioesterase [Thermoanaerobaculia bacterium]